MSSQGLPTEHEGLDCRLPQQQTVPVVIASPHSGASYPARFLAQAAVPLTALRRAEDAFVEELFAAAPELGMPLLAARFPRSYVDANPAALTDDRYGQCTWIGFDDSYQTSASLVWLRDKLGRWPHVRCNHSATIYDALLGSAGLAIIPCYAGAEDSSLVRLTPPLDLPSHGLWLVVHEDLRHQPRVRLVADNVAALFERHEKELRPET